MGSISPSCSTSPSRSTARRSIAPRRRITISMQALDQQLIARSTAALERGAPVRLDTADPQRQSHRRRHAVGRSRAHLRLCRPSRQHHPHPRQGHGWPELWRLAGAWRHAGARRRGQRLCRQGSFGRAHRDLSAARGDKNRAGRVDHRRQYRALRRDRPARSISAAWPASVSPCATPAPSRWWRASAITAANI